MSTHKQIGKICCIVFAVILLLTFLLMKLPASTTTVMSTALGYEGRLFDTSRVHTIDIEMDDWDSFIETCENEEYSACTVTIDHETYANIGIRAKGNTSLSSVSSMGSERYSFKLEFDQYDNSTSYYGLDKLCLNNIIQDNTYMKDYLVYQMMYEFGVDAPLCSYVYITVNGEDWGLYLAVEGVEESFLQRNYGNDYGELYKPDSQSMGGGRGNGKDFNMDDIAEPGDMGEPDDMGKHDDMGKPDDIGEPGDANPPDNMGGGEANQPSGMEEPNDIGEPGGMGKNGGMSSDDVKLQYIDDDPDSYSNIFDNAKTDTTDSDEERLINALKQLNDQENISEAVNIEEVIRYFVVHNFVCNGDSYTGSIVHNYYLYEKDGQMSMIPWDYNLAFGGFQSASDATSTVNEPIDTPVTNGSVEDRPMLAWIFSNEEYTQLYHQYFSEFISQYFDNGYLSTLIDTTQSLICSYVEKDPTKFCTYEEFETGVETLKEFCELRADSVAGQLEGSIPSTTAGQSEDSSSLIDASGLSLSDMGSMNTGQSMGEMENGKMPDFNDENSDAQMPDFNNKNSDGKMPDFNNT